MYISEMCIHTSVHRIPKLVNDVAAQIHVLCHMPKHDIVSKYAA